MLKQLKYFRKDLHRMVGKKKFRLLYIWLGRVFWGIYMYRLERGFYELGGRYYEAFRILLLPFINLMQAYTNIEIHYKADIGPGISVLHPALGVVISGHAVVGPELTLTGGNVIGIQGKCKPNELMIGSHCKMGANAVIIGPLQLANFINIGASACVVKDCLEERCSLVGVPAKMIKVYN